jgi:cell division septum initiation protein DivIVA
MNERVKELAEQAGVFAGDFAGSGLYSIHNKDEVEKFTELIIKKFDDVLLLEYLDCVGSQEKQSAQRIQRLREKVKTYFGVEK